MSDPSGPADQASSPPRAKWYYNIWFVLLMLFVVLGPFGLPLVWKHPRFSRRAKIILTLLTALYTVLLIDLTVRTYRALLQDVNQLLGLPAP